jgi:hypothetical protein
LAVFVKVLGVDRDAGIENGIKFVALGAGEKVIDEGVDLFGRINLGVVEIGLQIVEFVGVGFFT